MKSVTPTGRTRRASFWTCCGSEGGGTILKYCYTWESRGGDALRMTEWFERSAHLKYMNTLGGWSVPFVT